MLGRFTTEHTENYRVELTDWNPAIQDAGSGSQSVATVRTDFQSVATRRVETKF